MKTKQDNLFLAELGKNIKRLRNKHNISLRKLEVLCDLDRARISQYENGLRDPSATTLAKLAAGIGVHPSELLDFPLPGA
ncbi:helix-turn-helix domain-containing protein [Chitinophaga sp. RCC_12]|uniref:helix-turn-helix domain-containing protein n=1 Tax=Chitinophaga sp. RCC_12 TaxID=3239226 RepID=UPI00352646C2